MKDPDFYTEEVQLDGRLHEHQSVFSPDNSCFATITGNYVIVYDVKSGKRRLILNAESEFCGLKWQDNNTLLTISSNSTVNTWDLKAGESVSQFSFNYKGRFDWTYNVDESVYVVASKPSKKEKSSKKDKPSKKTNEQQQEVLKLNFDDAEAKVCVKLPLIIKHRREVFPSERFVLYCNNRDIAIVPYKDVMLKGSLRFHFDTLYDNLRYGDIKFKSVSIVNDHAFGVMSTGRILYWSGISEYGLMKCNNSASHHHYTEPIIAVTSLLSIFCGTANSRIDKWNLVTVGGGRYERCQVMERMDAPVEALWLSPDSHLLLAIMSDNSMLILNTVSLSVVSRPTSLHWPMSYDPNAWIGFYNDIEHPDYVVTNSRTGYIQWIDPAKWRTIGEFDVAKQNPPPRDCVSMPKYDWSDVYAVSCTSSLIVTAECRRFTRNKTVLKFFYRRNPSVMYDIKQMSCIKLDCRVKFIRSNMEEVRHDSSERVFRDHYAVVVDNVGKIRTFFPNPHESYRWSIDLKRTFDWQQTKVIDCSTIRSNSMATVNSDDKLSYSGVAVLIWDTETANLVDFIDKVPNVNQARWCPPHKFREFVLLLSSSELIAAYDSDAKTFLWIVPEPKMTLHTNLFTIIAYEKINKENAKAYVINHRDGSTIKEMMFKNPQYQVVATGNASNIRLSGLNSKGLSLLKPETEENLTLRDIESFTKSTPFSALIQQARADGQPASTNQQLHRTKILSARKLLEGSVYSLAPITKLAPAFIQSCLIAKSS